VCCDETAIRGRVHGERTACCGLIVYNEDELICCSGDTLRARVFGEAMDCSTDNGHNYCVDGTTGAMIAYSPDTQLCCDAAIHQLATSNSTCCGEAVYTTSVYPRLLCCGSWAVGGPSAEDRACCGGSSVYDTTAWMCCDGLVPHKVFDDTTACCGTAVYSTTLSTCCDGAVHFAANDNFHC